MRTMLGNWRILKAQTIQTARERKIKYVNGIEGARKERKDKSRADLYVEASTTGEKFPLSVVEKRTRPSSGESRTK